MRILIIDNNIDQDEWGSPSLSRFAALVPGASVYTRRAPANDLPASILSYDRVIISGSRTSVLEHAPWITTLEKCTRKLIDHGKPVLGVCYGHQIIARVLGGMQAVRKSSTPEFGWTRIDVEGESKLFAGLPPSFYSFSSHYDEVCELPKGMRNLARSENCEVQACQLEDRPVYGIQFHPEKTLEEATKRFEYWIRTKKPEPLLGMKEGPEVYDSKVGLSIFQNFLAL